MHTMVVLVVSGLALLVVIGLAIALVAARHAPLGVETDSGLILVAGAPQRGNSPSRLARKDASPLPSGRPTYHGSGMTLGAPVAGL